VKLHVHLPGSVSVRHRQRCNVTPTPRRFAVLWRARQHGSLYNCQQQTMQTQQPRRVGKPLLRGESEWFSAAAADQAAVDGAHITHVSICRYDRYSVFLQHAVSCCNPGQLSVS